MLRWLKKANPSLGRPTISEQPNPSEPENPRATAAANGTDTTDSEPMWELPTFPGLPNPADTENPTDTAAMNREVEKAMRAAASRKRKRGNYRCYTPEVRAKIAKLCMEMGASKTAKKMSEELGKEVNESTVRSIRKSYEKELLRQGGNEFTSFPRKNVGRPAKRRRYVCSVIYEEGQVTQLIFQQETETVSTCGGSSQK